MAHLLGAEALHLAFPTRVVFDSVTLGLSDGDRVGIVGRNGDGKSSLLGMLAGTVTPDSGQVTRRGGLRVALLDQSDTLDPTNSVGRTIVGDSADYEWAGDARIRDVLAGLAPDIAWEAPVGSLSGGQRRRVALAALLVGDWDVIALDEPTNHLDVEGITWLAGHLKTRWPKRTGGLLVVTHDRWFLDEVVSTTWEVHDRMVEPFDGGYAAYILQRVERDRLAAAAETKRQNLLRKELAWLRRGPPARTSKPRFRIEAANALIADVPEPRDRLALSRMAMSRLGKDVVDLIDVGVSFDHKPVLTDVEWRLAPGERSAVLGANGAGKSTLLGLIAGTVSPTEGEVRTGKTVRLAMLDQQFAELDEIADDRVREVLSRAKASYVVDGKELTPAQLLERLGFAREHLASRVRELSGGQKRRLQLLLVLMSEPNVLILDEPTNDVDIDMLAATEDLLDSWPGTLIVVSHDRYLVERVTDQQHAIIDGRLRHLPGGVDEYLRLRAGGTAPTASASALSPSSDQGAPGGAGQGSPAGLSEVELKAARREIRAAERQMDRLARQMERLYKQMADHDANDYQGILDLDSKLRAAQEENTALEERWLELSELAG